MPDISDSRRQSSPVDRIGSLANIPVFFKLDGKRVVLVGGSEAALWKAELLAAAGAVVEVYADTLVAGFEELSTRLLMGRVNLVRRNWTPSDLACAALAVGSFADEGEAETFASAARAAGVPVNVVDRPSFCDFQFGAIVNRSPLVIGISTDGAAPVFGQAVRSLIESLLPDSFGHWAKAARDLRRSGERFGDTASEKRGFWQRFTDLALRSSGRAPSAEDLRQLQENEAAIAGQEPVAILDIEAEVDALTIGALRALRAADDIFFDEDVPLAVMEFARREARRYPVPTDQAGSHAVANQLIQAASSGRVVRLMQRRQSCASAAVLESDALRAVGIRVIRIPEREAR